MIVRNAILRQCTALRLTKAQAADHQYGQTTSTLRSAIIRIPDRSDFLLNPPRYTAVMQDVKNQLAELALRLRKRDDARVEMEIAMSTSRRLTELLLLSREDSMRVNADAVNPSDFLEILAAEYAEFSPTFQLNLMSNGRLPVLFLMAR